MFCPDFPAELHVVPVGKMRVGWCERNDFKNTEDPSGLAICTSLNGNEASDPQGSAPPVFVGL